MHNKNNCKWQKGTSIILYYMENTVHRVTPVRNEVIQCTNVSCWSLPVHTWVVEFMSYKQIRQYKFNNLYDTSSNICQTFPIWKTVSISDSCITLLTKCIEAAYFITALKIQLLQKWLLFLCCITTSFLLK